MTREPNDFSFYDHVLDTSVMVGAIPAANGWTGGKVPLATCFTMARGLEGDAAAPACDHDHGPTRRPRGQTG